MSRFSLFLAWLIVAAVPLQGLAAGSMLFCGPNHGEARVAAAQQVQHLHGSAAAVEHEHSKQVDAVDVQAKKIGSGGGKKLPDAAHKCGVCASCCNIVAITEFPRLMAFAAVTQAESAEPFVLIHVRPSEVPDKPPRV